MNELCGAFFGPKVWHSTDQYRRTIWQCNGKFANEERCHTPVVDTETIQRLFIKAYNLMMNREIRRRTRVVGAFPDGNSALILVCARLRHVAGTQWDGKKYMNMKDLEVSSQDISAAG